MSLYIFDNTFENHPHSMAAGGTIFFPEKCPKQYFRKKHGFNNGYEAHIKANKKHGAEPLLRKKIFNPAEGDSTPLPPFYLEQNSFLDVLTIPFVRNS